MSSPLTVPAVAARPAPAAASVRRNIREAALKLFVARGFDSVTVDDVAQAAGISRRTCFRYVPVREDLIFSDHIDYFEAVAARLAAGSGEPILVAGNAIRVILDGYLADREFSLRRFALVTQIPSLRDRELFWMARYQPVLGAYLASRTEGERDGMYAEITAAAVVAAHNESVRHWLRSPDTEDPAALFAELLDSIDGSMGSPGPRGTQPATNHPERRNVVVIDSTLSREEIEKILKRQEH
jgi:AcrR family transcriptional regulator